MRYLPALFLLFFCFLAIGQVKVISSWVDAETLKYEAENSTLSPYYLMINFSNPSNMILPSKSQLKRTISQGKTVLFLIKKQDVKLPIDANVTYSFHPGCVPTGYRHNDSIVYQLPIGKGKSTYVQEFKYITILESHGSVGNAYSLAFLMALDDTVFAARKGLVVGVEESLESNPDAKTSSRVNYVEILHDDCTLARYQIFQTNKVFVKPGIRVLPGDPIGIVGGSHYPLGSQMRFIVTYLDTINASDREAYVHLCVIPRFATSLGTQFLKEGDFRMVSSSEIITQELSKGEIKKLQKATSN